ncbi:unnamed protein product [Owenia fusiformis]|uniref:DNA-binding protein RFX6 n=1 Tax=Owenia fusiformis TaxID=6347 RepID=A0A8S4PSI4_OWEFU|nr:unnamed protein product [Owenia fusiformis]
MEPVDPTENWLKECLEGGTRVTEVKVDNIEAELLLTKTEYQKENKVATKPHSTPRTLKWLQDNYELGEGVCIPRSTLYIHYLDYCNTNDCQPVNAASFGKIIRQQFPQITTRRLGTRGQSKYHYYGIAIKETSVYYEVIFSRKGLQSGDGKKDSSKQSVSYSPRSKLGTILPDFPSLDEVKLPLSVSREKVTTFLMMYRTHCQRILDTVIRANFDEVQSFLLHFWQGMPDHIIPVLGYPVIANLIGICDSITYSAVSNVLMPSVLQPLPESLTAVIRKFSRDLEGWVKAALENLPDNLKLVKLDLCRRFSQLLKRQTSLNHLCQASRSVIHNSDITAQMLDDWSMVDLESICKQTLYTMDRFNERDFILLSDLYREFELLLEDEAPLESYAEWLDSMVERCVEKPCKKKDMPLNRVARQFLLIWSCFGTRVIRDMTLHSAPSFGSFHLVHLMFDDYVLYKVEQLHNAERTSHLQLLIRGLPLPDFTDELVLPKPCLDGLNNPCSSRLSVSPYSTGSIAQLEPCQLVTPHSNKDATEHCKLGLNRGFSMIQPYETDKSRLQISHSDQYSQQASPTYDNSAQSVGVSQGCPSPRYPSSSNYSHFSNTMGQGFTTEILNNQSVFPVRHTGLREDWSISQQLNSSGTNNTSYQSSDMVPNNYNTHQGYSNHDSYEHSVANSYRQLNTDSFYNSHAAISLVASKRKLESVEEMGPRRQRNRTYEPLPHASSYGRA